MTAKKTQTTEQRIGRILRVNTYSVTHVISPKVKSPKGPEKATGPSADLFERPIYKTGDGDVIASHRPGAEDHENYKSFGNSV